MGVPPPPDIEPTIIFKSFFPLKHDEKSRGYPSYRGVEFYWRLKIKMYKK